jgi:large subunit ribosomal protein L10
MTLTKSQKQELLGNLKSLFEGSGASVASDYSGLKAVDMTDLRKDLKGKGMGFVVTKNTLVKKALQDLNLGVDEAILDRPVAFAFGKDEVEVCKALNDFAKSHEGFEILGGIINKEQADASKVKSLALLPSREELQGKLVGILAAPSYGLVNVLHANIRGLVSVLNQYNKKRAN